MNLQIKIPRYLKHTRLTAQVRPNKPSSLALLQCNIKFNSSSPYYPLEIDLSKYQGQRLKHRVPWRFSQTVSSLLHLLKHNMGHSPVRTIYIFKIKHFSNHSEQTGYYANVHFQRLGLHASKLLSPCVFLALLKSYKT